jgi:hypothetical protein
MAPGSRHYPFDLSEGFLELTSSDSPDGSFSVLAGDGLLFSNNRTGLALHTPVEMTGGEVTVRLYTQADEPPVVAAGDLAVRAAAASPLCLFNSLTGELVDNVAPAGEYLVLARPTGQGFALDLMPATTERERELVSALGPPAAPRSSTWLDVRRSPAMLALTALIRDDPTSWVHEDQATNTVIEHLFNGSVEEAARRWSDLTVGFCRFSVAVEIDGVPYTVCDDLKPDIAASAYVRTGLADDVAPRSPSTGDGAYRR